MLTKLLEKSKPSQNSKVQVQNTEVTEDEDEEDIDWEFDQMLPEVMQEDMLGKRPRYGFNLQYSAYFQPLQEELSEIIDLPDPDMYTTVTALENEGTLNELKRRKKLRVDAEDKKFQPEYYMYVPSDVCDHVIEEILSTQNKWQHALLMSAGGQWHSQRSSNGSNNRTFSFNHHRPWTS